MKLVNFDKKFIFIGIIIILIAFWLFYTLLLPVIWESLYPRHYHEEVLQAANNRDLDPNLLFAIIKVESKFNEKAVSDRGAIGLMQVMPTTGSWAAENITLSTFDYEDLFIPEINIALGTWYLDYLMDEFDEDLALTLAAYNAGQGNVRKWVENGTWDGDLETLDQVPYSETEKYVENVIYNYRRYNEIYQ